MSEPISGTAAGVAGWKIIGGLAGMGAAGAGLAAFVVMAMTKPKTDQEWRVALICTLVSSIGGGSALVRWLGFQHWVEDPFGMIAMLLFAFACGLPGWALVRAVFVFIDKHRDAGIDEVAKDLKDMV
ncbi:MAG: hypothetical protein ACXU8N_18365 [Telluria sp.]